MIQGPVVQWLRYLACTEETRVQFTAGPYFSVGSLQTKLRKLKNGNSRR